MHVIYHVYFVISFHQKLNELDYCKSHNANMELILTCPQMQITMCRHELSSVSGFPTTICVFNIYVKSIKHVTT